MDLQGPPRTEGSCPVIHPHSSPTFSLPSPTPQSQARVLQRQIQKQVPEETWRECFQAEFRLQQEVSLHLRKNATSTQVFFFLAASCGVRDPSTLIQESKACPCIGSNRVSATGPGMPQHQISLNGASTNSPGSLGLFKSDTQELPSVPESFITWPFPF